MKHCEGVDKEEFWCYFDGREETSIKAFERGDWRRMHCYDYVQIREEKRSEDTLVLETIARILELCGGKIPPRKTENSTSS